MVVEVTADVVPGDGEWYPASGSGSEVLARTHEYTMVEVVVVVYSPCWSVDRSPLPGE